VVIAYGDCALLHVESTSEEFLDSYPRLRKYLKLAEIQGETPVLAWWVHLTSRGHFFPGVDMDKSNHVTRLYGLHSMALGTLALLLWAGAPASGQSATGQSVPVPNQDNDTKGWQIANMDKFLDGHSEIEEQLRKDPSLIRNEEFVEKHPAL
jgi:hypothetical protein